MSFVEMDFGFPSQNVVLTGTDPAIIRFKPFGSAAPVTGVGVFEHALGVQGWQIVS